MGATECMWMGRVREGLHCCTSLDFTSVWRGCVLDCCVQECHSTINISATCMWRGRVRAREGLNCCASLDFMSVWRGCVVRLLST